MQRVITINLNGHAYQLDESAYDALRAYLNLAESQLKDNPDRTEILADFEQAIAEKCGRFLGPNKTVVTAVEMQQIVTEMGPVRQRRVRRTPRHGFGEGSAVHHTGIAEAAVQNPRRRHVGRRL